ncbi:NINE protein [Notoacmeibacter sp. MSK16QG-6]|uniref:NINE protein n=1 Tax=Notoacmeibacter sp. MSK16QG-6 TaxID=2957982 RepID=UPI0020A17581|nr:NINE protein [Notoacmeibacter sp. MSK16QG-6]MCP1198169.1 NINE protein [Notoacmeibacter sp. MSK16QG-6]
MKTKGIAYLLWALCLFGVCGIHRFYTGRWVTGIIWFFTVGLLGIGQIIDLFLIPGQVRSANLDDQMEAIMTEKRVRERLD